MSDRETTEVERLIREWMGEVERAVACGDEHRAECRRNWAFGAYMAWQAGAGRLVEPSVRNEMAALAGLR